MSSIAVILSAGVGQRFGDNLPKQYHKVNGKMVVTYVVEALKKSNVDEIIVACGNEDFQAMIEEEFNLKTILGGETRNITIQNALDYIRKNTTHDKVLFCDSARPNLTPEYANECINALDEYDSVITTQKITDSLGHIDEVNLDRSNYYLIQTPECFKLNALDNFDINSTCTAIVQQLDKSKKIYNNFNLKNNIKITYVDDLKIASILLKE